LNKGSISGRGKIFLSSPKGPDEPKGASNPVKTTPRTGGCFAHVPSWHAQGNSTLYLSLPLYLMATAPTDLMLSV